VGVQEAVIVAALALLRSMGAGGAVPPIEVVEPDRFPRLQQQVEALRGFRLVIDGQPDPVIYIVRTTQTYRRADRGDLPSVALIASTIVHERVHGENGDERAALTTEADFLRRFIRRHLLRLQTHERRYLEKHIDALKRTVKSLTPRAAATPSLFALER
jgi:hypothetical protein